MKKKLFSIDILHMNGKTLVSWWRWNNKKESSCFKRVIQVKTNATYEDRKSVV